MAECTILAEKNGVDRQKLIKLLSSTIFDCLIYKGYGDRVANRDHRPGGFSLDLGLKDMSLVSKAALDVSAPMPFLSHLMDRYVSSKAKGRGNMDWSAIALDVAESAGIDCTIDIEKNNRIVSEKNLKS
jgi:3-hydroxyisobutyrate dehydrogenase-like beta-hydroxyacid dehydrogenase